MKKLWLMSLVILSFVSVFAAGCGKKEISAEMATLTVGDTKRLEIKNTYKEIIWKSSDEKIADVSKKGVVKGKEAGKAKITAKIKGKKETFTCAVTVKPNGAEVSQNRNFSGNLYGSLLDQVSNGKNACISPISIKGAFALAYNGATDDAKADIERILEMKETDFWSKYNRLNSYETLNLAESIWANFDINDHFAEKVEEGYDAEIHGKEDFNYKKINRWCSDKTNGKIKEIVGPDQIDDLPEYEESMHLINATYFNDKWEDPYTEDDVIYDGTFTDINGEETKTDFITDDIEHGAYYETDNATAFSIPYENNMSFIGILPKNKGDFRAEYIDLKKLIRSRTYNYDVDIKFPMFKSDFTAEGLKEALIKDGIGKLFDADNPQFMNMSKNGKERGCIGDISHKTYIDVNLEGTEAAAVTDIAMTGYYDLADEGIKQVYLDRPFLYAIYDEETEEILFLGKYYMPNK